MGNTAFGATGGRPCASQSARVSLRAPGRQEDRVETLEASIPDLALMELRIPCLYRVDAEGRLLGVNEPGGSTAPPFFLGRTAAGDVTRFRHDLPVDLAVEVRRILGSPKGTGHERLSVGEVEALRAALSPFAPNQGEYAGPAYRFPARIFVPSGAIEITAQNGQILPEDWLDMLAHLDVRAPIFAVVQHRRAVSICCSSRLGPHAAEAGLETLPDFRGRGYAVAVTAAWALAIRARGLIPLYSTERENLASHGVARRLGLIQYGADFHARSCATEWLPHSAP
jgi:GNAT superfamily N-acetyltransferase